MSCMVAHLVFNSTYYSRALITELAMHGCLKCVSQCTIFTLHHVLDNAVGPQSMLWGGMGMWGRTLLWGGNIGMWGGTRVLAEIVLAMIWGGTRVLGSSL